MRYQLRQAGEEEISHTSYRQDEGPAGRAFVAIGCRYCVGAGVGVGVGVDSSLNVALVA